MNDWLDLVGERLDASAIRQLGARVGASPEQTGSAVESALPLLMGAMQRNASSAGGAASLLSALDRDHDGSVLDDLAGLFAQGPTASGTRSLDHIFGGKRGTVETAVARTSGLQSGQVQQLLAMLAPLVLGALGKAKRQGGVDAGGLGGLLGGAVGKMQQKSPGAGGLVGLLDADGDGSVVDDLLEKAGGSSGGGLGGMLGGLLGGKR